jgi:16S rRNA G966 N2-methylase RsmD
MGIEAISRGAKSAYFVDNSRSSIALTKENLRRVAFEERATIAYIDCLTFLKSTTQKFNLIYLDPPYAYSDYLELLIGCEGVLLDGGLLLYEHSSNLALPELLLSLAKEKVYKFGKTTVSSYLRKEPL